MKKKGIIWILGIIVSLVGMGIIGMQYLINQTKSQSPEKEISYHKGDIDIDIFYCRPSMRGREIFGKLVPFHEVWRTGANEATTFKTKNDINLEGQTLPAGNYTLWTIPGPESWKVIWNSKSYPWGVNFKGKPSREENYDVLSLDIPVYKTKKPVEMFTISLDTNVLTMRWETTQLDIDID